MVQRIHPEESKCQGEQTFFFFGVCFAHMRIAKNSFVPPVQPSCPVLWIQFFFYFTLNLVLADRESISNWKPPSGLSLLAKTRNFTSWDDNSPWQLLSVTPVLFLVWQVKMPALNALKMFCRSYCCCEVVLTLHCIYIQSRSWEQSPTWGHSVPVEQIRTCCRCPLLALRFVSQQTFWIVIIGKAHVE